MLADFLDEQIESMPDQESALTTLKAFVTVDGTKRQASVTDVVSFSRSLGKPLEDKKVEEIIADFLERRIIKELARDFTIIVFTSILLALPISYYLTKGWLDGFAYHIAADAWYYISAGLLALVISWLTVGSLAFKASQVNPTICLKED